MNFPVTGTWYDYFLGTQATVSAASQNYTLAPGEFKLFTTRKMTDPFASTESPQLKGQSGHLKIYPNPTDGKVIIQSERTIGTFMIVNISGQVVYQGDLSGFYRKEINLEHLAPGIYLVQAGDTVEKLVKY